MWSLVLSSVIITRRSSRPAPSKDYAFLFSSMVILAFFLTTWRGLSFILPINSIRFHWYPTLIPPLSATFVSVSISHPSTRYFFPIFLSFFSPLSILLSTPLIMITQKLQIPIYLFHTLTSTDCYGTYKYFDDQLNPSSIKPDAIG